MSRRNSVYSKVVLEGLALRFIIFFTGLECRD